MAKFLSTPQEWALSGITMIWGLSFLVIRLAMAYGGPLCFVGLRFVVAFLVLIVLSWRSLRGLTLKEFLGGILLGILVFGGFVLQTYGMVKIEAAKSAFITAFYVPLVPLFEWVLMRHKPSLRALIGVALAFPGVLLLTGAKAMHLEFSLYEMATIICAVIFALEIVVTGMIAPNTNPKRIVILEVLVTAVLSFALIPLVNEPWPTFSWFFILSALILGLASALIQSVIVWAQRSIPPTSATIIYTAEPVWAGLFAFMAGESVTLNTILGGSLVIAGILLSSLKLKDSK
ncbi:MAG: DMT family transporter [Desulfovibrionaceae bacterium]|nr:DMT family transporter [Desulfovibrionaceae bacterium]